MLISRRSFIGRLGAAVIAPYAIRLSVRGAPRSPARIAAIADLHHGLAPDALTRLHAFATEVARRHPPDAVLQIGDFTYSDAGAAECLDVWRAMPGPKLSVLGNHDMDKCDKDTAMRACGMSARYWSRVLGGYRFVALDLNYFKKDGALVSYAMGNYFADGASCNWADPEQLVWLEHEITSAAEPVVVLSHQPLGMGDAGQPLPPEQREVFDVIARASAAHPSGGVVACISGHLHVDRLEHVDGIPCLCLN
ncbi:MAG TPA: metallophosphoesterase, partial [Gemmatimonadaceae bacterium]|nr:metallophosphoesterase [Gemmatimonadaceae bacterium]